MPVKSWWRLHRLAHTESKAARGAPVTSPPSAFPPELKETKPSGSQRQGSTSSFADQCDLAQAAICLEREDLSACGLPYCKFSQLLVSGSSQPQGSFLVPIWPLSNSLRGRFAVLIWRPVQSRSGGELPPVAQACQVDWKPTDQLVFPIQDKVVIQRAFLCPLGDAHGRAFFCYQLLTACIFSVIGKCEPSKSGNSCSALTQATEVTHGSG
jgi:hypothetical protein